MPFRQVNEQMLRQMTPESAPKAHQKGQGQRRSLLVAMTAGRSVENKRIKWPDRGRESSDQTLIMG